MMLVRIIGIVKVSIRKNIGPLVKFGLLFALAIACLANRNDGRLYVSIRNNDLPSL